MRIETLYDQGTAVPSEDRLILKLPFVGVADGVSGLYVPSEGPLGFNGLTGGQMAAETLLKTVVSASVQESLEEIILRANSTIRRAQEPYGFYDRGEIERIAGATIAVVKIGTERIEIVQCGDCMALWVFHDGRTEITYNQVIRHEMEMRAKIAELMEKHSGDRSKMWEEFGPFLAAIRRQRVNQPGGYGLLNGQHEAEETWQRFVLQRQDIALLLIFTDGLIYPEEAGSEDLDQRILGLYRDGGLGAILAETRRKEKGKKDTSHIDYAEASGIAIKL